MSIARYRVHVAAPNGGPGLTFEGSYLDVRWALLDAFFGDLTLGGAAYRERAEKIGGLMTMERLPAAPREEKP